MKHKALCAVETDVTRFVEGDFCATEAEREWWASLDERKSEECPQTFVLAC